MYKITFDIVPMQRPLYIAQYITITLYIAPNIWQYHYILSQCITLPLYIAPPLMQNYVWHAWKSAVGCEWYWARILWCALAAMEVRRRCCASFKRQSQQLVSPMRAFYYGAQRLESIDNICQQSVCSWELPWWNVNHGSLPQSSCSLKSIQQRGVSRQIRNLTISILEMQPFYCFSRSLTGNIQCKYLVLVCAINEYKLPGLNQCIL